MRTEANTVTPWGAANAFKSCLRAMLYLAVLTLVVMVHMMSGAEKHMKRGEWRIAVLCLGSDPVQTGKGTKIPP